VKGRDGRTMMLRRIAPVVALVLVLGLATAACSKSSGDSGIATQSVFVQKFRFHGLPASIPGGDMIINFTNRESLPILHEMILFALPEGKTSQDVIDASKAKGADAEADFLSFGEIGEVNTGSTKAQVFDLPAGTYAIACWEDGNLGGGKGKVHAARGMVFQFTVTS
jgi:hypothetical protein